MMKRFHIYNKSIQPASFEETDVHLYCFVLGKCVHLVVNMQIRAFCGDCEERRFISSLYYRYYLLSFCYVNYRIKWVIVSQHATDRVRSVRCMFFCERLL